MVAQIVFHSGRPVAAAQDESLFARLEDTPKPTSLADSFKVSLVRPPEEASNSGQKMLLNVSSALLFDDDEMRTLDAYDALFEKYSLYCNGRWLGAQVLQDSQDLLYIQHITFMTKPDVVIETGTYKGGLTHFFASILDWIEPGGQQAQIVSVDVHQPDLVFAANWFCPVCIDCIKPYTTEAWQRRVRFVQGHADKEPVYQEILHHLVELGVLGPVKFGDRELGSFGEEPNAESIALRGLREVGIQSGKVVIVNLDANHEFDGIFKELLFYAPLVTKGSYLIVQDTKLDKIWGTDGPSAALQRFLDLMPVGEFVIEPELKFHAYSQHTYVRRAQVTVHFADILEKISSANA